MILRQAAFCGEGKMLRGNLHTHTTRSDGRGSPETVVRHYAALGYDFLALTDHCVYNYRSYGPQTDLMILPGLEVDTNITEGRHHCFHMLCLGSGKEDGNAFEQDEKYGPFASADCAKAQEMLDGIVSRGNVPVFCHPQWSGNSAREMLAVTGYSLMEIWNSGVAVACETDTNAAYWDELLAAGRRVYGVATDDSHLVATDGLGYVMVRAEKTPRSVLDALQKGAFYASCGPEIHDFYVEDGKAVVLCSPAASITFRTFYGPYGVARADGITGHQDNLLPGSGYVRAVVTDAQGRRAWTNPIFLED